MNFTKKDKSDFKEIGIYLIILFVINIILITIYYIVFTPLTNIVINTQMNNDSSSLLGNTFSSLNFLKAFAGVFNLVFVFKIIYIVYKFFHRKNIFDSGDVK
jgi:hypothetical protein